VLGVRDVPRPERGPDQVLVAVRAADINPTEAAMRAGRVREFFPLTFPSGSYGPSGAQDSTSLRSWRGDLLFTHRGGQMFPNVPLAFPQVPE
jgi:hypothetical protein